MSGVQSVARVTEGVVAPLIGPLVDRHGPRVLMIVGGTIAGLMLLVLTQVHNLWQFYLVRGILVALGFALMGSLATNTSISNWFVRQRGRAIAIAGMGTSVAGFILAPVTVWIIATWGWRSCFLLFALMTWALVLAPAALFMRRRPEDLGLKPDGDDPNTTVAGRSSGAGDSASEKPHLAPEPIWTRKAVISTSAFWLLIVSFSSANLAFQGINISLAPYASDLGFGPATIAGILSLRALIMVAAAPFWGLLAERFSIGLVRVSPFLIQSLSCLCFLLADKGGFLWLAIIVYGLGFAGAGVMQEVVWASYFGRLTLGKVRSTAVPFLVAFSAAGPVAMNVIFDTTGSYRIAYLLFLALFIIGSLLMWIVQPPLPRQWARPDDAARLPSQGPS